MRLVQAALAAAFLLALAGCKEEERHPVLFKDPIAEVAVYDNQSQVLVDWMKRGYKGATAINVDYHDDLRYVPEEKIKELKKLAGRWDETSSRADAQGAKSLFTVADWLYPAYRLGIIKRLYWVAPSRLLEHPDLEAGARDLLRAFGYPEEVVKTFKKDGGAVKGEIFGLEVWVSSPAGLPPIRGPVLLTVDVDYFSNKLKKENPPELGMIGDFFTQMRGKGLMVKHASVAYSVEGGDTDIVARHIGEEMIEAVKRPDAVLREDYPPLWAARSKGFGLLREGRADLALEAFDAALKALGEEPSLLSGRAVSLALLERDKEAMGVLERLSSGWPEYGRTHIHIGRALAGKEKPERAERYFKAYVDKHPRSADGLFAYGDFLYAGERDDEALRAYMAVLAISEDVSAVMYAGDALMHLGRHQEAKEIYGRGLKLLSEVGYRSMRDYPEAARNMGLLGVNSEQ